MREPGTAPIDGSRGVDVGCDLAAALPGYQVDLVLDVGANVGDWTRSFRRAFASARCECFEPGQAAFARLQEAFAGDPRVRCHRLAVGAVAGTGTLVLQGRGPMHFLAGASHGPRANPAWPTEPCPVVTLDEFCKERGHERVSFLKVDTEGGDLDVLRGAAGLLGQQRIDVVQVEAGMNPENDRHVPFEALKGHLESHGYRLFALYEQVHEWPSRSPHLRRADPVFLSRRMIDAHRG